MITWEQASSSKVHIPLHYAKELSGVASRFGARSRREARQRPGGFNRPVVGHDPNYYLHAANKVIQTAIKSDSELESMYLKVGSLSSRLESQSRKPYTIDQPSPLAALELRRLTESIDTSIASKELTIGLEGKYRTRAIDISAFAIRVIAGNYEGRGLYPGLEPTKPVNTPEYWYDLEQRLTLPA